MSRFSLKTLLIAVAICAACLGVWSFLFRKAVYIRSPRPDDRVGQQEMRGFPHNDEEIRNIAFAIGRFNHWTRFHISLIAVKAGKQEVQNDSVLRTHYRDHVIFPSTFETMLVLRTVQSPHGAITFLDHKGALMPAGSGHEHPHEILASFSYSYNGSITPGRPYIVYIEGDAPITVNRSMTSAEFAKSHPGSYFVVTAELK